MKSTLKTLEQMEQTTGWQPPQVDGEHTVSPIDLANDSVAATLATARWLIRTGLMGLVDNMMRLSREYGFPWAASWRYHLDNPDWLSRAMAQTFMLLRPEDKEAVRVMYDDWLWYQNHLDMHKMVHPEFNALCYLLDSQGKRVCNDNGAVTVLRGLKGPDKLEALKTLDKRYYEFKAWW